MKKNVSIVCEDCGEIFSSRNKMFKHLEEMHGFVRPDHVSKTTKEARKRHKDRVKMRGIKLRKARDQEQQVSVRVKPEYVLKTKRKKVRGQNKKRKASEMGLRKPSNVKSMLCPRIVRIFFVSYLFDKLTVHIIRPPLILVVAHFVLIYLHTYITLESQAVGETCPFGSNCTKDHDVVSFLKHNRLPDLKDMCVHYDKYKWCPYGINCRFGSSHVQIKTDKSSFELSGTKRENGDYDSLDIKNHLTSDLQTRLRKRTYVFSKDDDDDDDETKTQQGPIVLSSTKRPIDWKNKIVVAPLTTVGNLPFRRIMKDFGADVTVSEMTLAGSLLSGKRSEWGMLKRHKCEDIFGVQIAGSSASSIGRAVSMISRETDVDFIDINCGCPIDVAVRKGFGSGLMRNPNKLCRVVQSAVNELDVVRRSFRVPVPELTVKMRTGFLDGKRNADMIVKKFQSFEKLSHVSIHGRTREARYSRRADLEYVKSCVSIQDSTRRRVPILFNGDVYSFEDWDKALRDEVLTSCMIARGALVKPWLPTEIKERRHWDISSSERFEILRKYTKYGLEHWGSDQIGVDKTRRFLLEWMSFTCRYVPVGLLERVPMRINERLETSFVGRDDMETWLGSGDVNDWVRLTEMLLGPVYKDFNFKPKHRSRGTLTS